MMWLAGLAAALAVVLLFPARGPGLGRLAGRGRAHRAAGRGGGLHRPRRVATLWRPAGFAVAGLLVAGVVVGPLTWFAAIAAVTLTAAWAVWSRVVAKRAVRAGEEVVRAASLLGSLLGFGHIPAVAIELAAEECPVLAPVVVATHLGGDPWEVLETLAARPGQSGLAAIARAGRVSVVSGAPMAASLQRVRESLEEEAETAAVVAAELSGPRATGQMLAVLPLVGLGIAFAIGADPMGFFSGGWPGRACLVVGVGLACLGVVWTDVLARRAGGAPAGEGGI